MKFRGIVFFLLLVALSAGAAWGQFSSSIEGSVTDSSGAVVPGTTIVLTNIDTGVTNKTQTDGAGFYKVPALAPGRYKVSATFQGFASMTENDILLTATQVRDISFKFQPVSVTSSVEVTAADTAVDTAQAKISSVIDTRQINELGMEGNNIYDVVAQTPGVTGTGTMGQPASNADIFYATTTPAVSANGQPNSGNTYLLDGISLDDSPSGGDAKLVPNPNSVQEVEVSTNNYSAEFGKGSSLVTEITSKSGTNSWHGSMFEQFQNNNLTARTEFQNTPDPATGHIINPFQRNEFGGFLGGPIKKDRTFFLVSWDQVISNFSSAFLTTVETPQFTSFMKTNYPNATSTSLFTQYPANIAPSTLTNFQTVAQVEQSQVPSNQQLCSQPGATTGPLGMPCDMPLLGTGDLSFSTIHNGYQYNIRIDQSFPGGKDRIYGNVYHTMLSSSGGEQVRSIFNIIIPQDATFAAINYTHVFSPSVLNEAAGGFTRTTAFIPCNVCQLLPIGVNNMAGFGDGFAPTGFAQNDFEWRDMLSVIHGKHALKMGFEIYHNQDFAPFTRNDARNQSYNFETVFDFAEDKPSQENGIDYNPITGGIMNGNRYYLDSTYGYYVQDDWRVNSRLTVNLGLRWDYLSNPREAHDTLSTIRLGSAPSLEQQIAGISVAPAKHPFTYVPLMNLAPRVGFAWQPFADGKWSVRGAFGIFYNRGGNTLWSDTETNNPPFAASLNADIHVPSGPQPVYGLCGSATFPFNCPRPPLPVDQFNPRGGILGTQVSIGGPDPSLKLAYAENMFLGVQRQFRSHWIAEADFTRSTGIHMYSVINRNRFDGDRNPVTGVITFLNPYFGAINYADNSNHSTYNAGTFFIQKLFHQGYSFQVAFTTGKTIDLMSAPPGRDKGSDYAPVIDAYNLNAQRGLSDQDVSKQLSFNFVWDVPKPKTSSKALNIVAGGWEVTSLGELISGLPQTVFTTNESQDFNLDGNNYDLPNTPSFGHTLKGLNRSDYLKGTFTASQFPLPVGSNGLPTGVEGNLGRNTFRGPGFAQVDSGFAKNNHVPWFVNGGANLQFRVDVYNLFNRVNLTGWDTNLADGNFGKATNTLQARTLQLSTKFVF